MLRVIDPTWASSGMHFNIGPKDIVIEDRPFNICLVLNPMRIRPNPLLELFSLFFSILFCFFSILRFLNLSISDWERDFGRTSLR